jgi:Tol biopolymer transport system component
MVQLDGSGYRVLDDSQVAYAPPAISPDGQTVAYDRAGQAWLYRQDTGPQPFDLASFGLSSDAQLRLRGPAWSPDGQQLVWFVQDDSQPGGSNSIGLFDLQARTVQFLHPHRPGGGGAASPVPAWSHDGQWLAFHTQEPNANNTGLWVMRIDGRQEEEYNLDTGYKMARPVWSPDGRWLAVKPMSKGIRLAEVGTWATYLLDLPSDAYPVAWVTTCP